MADVMMIQGKVTNVYDSEDFARLLGELLGSDAEYYYRAQTDIDDILDHMSDSELFSHCAGECSKTEEIQEHYEFILRDVKEELECLRDDMLNQTKTETMKTIIELIKKINAEL